MKLRFLMMIAVTTTLAACGNSPLFNHDTAANIKPTSDNDVVKGECPIEFHQAKLCASIEWTQGPTSQGENTFTVKFWDAIKRDSAGPFVDPANAVFVELWMPDMGHGSSPTTVVKSAVGVYQVSKVYFIMAGDWNLRLQLKTDATVTEQAVLPVSVR